MIFFFFCSADKERKRERGGRRNTEGTKREGMKEKHLMEGPSEVHVDMGEKVNKHRKRHQSSVDNLNESEKDRTKNSHRHGSDRKKSKKV